MVRTVLTFAAGLAAGLYLALPATVNSQSQGKEASPTSVVQLRLYTIDKGRLDDFAAAWQAGVYPLRLSSGYKIPFAAKIPATNQFVWLVSYEGPEPWERKEAAYYASSARAALSPNPAQWIARPEQWMVTTVVGLPTR